MLKYIQNEYNLNQINQQSNQFTLLTYNHMNIITIKYIQNHTGSINYLQHAQSYTFKTFTIKIQWQSLKDSKWILGQSKATLGFICNYTIASNANSFLWCPLDISAICYKQVKDNWSVTILQLVISPLFYIYSLVLDSNSCKTKMWTHIRSYGTLSGMHHV